MLFEKNVSTMRGRDLSGKVWMRAQSQKKRKKKKKSEQKSEVYQLIESHPRLESDPVSFLHFVYEDPAKTAEAEWQDFGRIRPVDLFTFFFVIGRSRKLSWR